MPDMTRIGPVTPQELLQGLIAAYGDDMHSVVVSVCLKAEADDNGSYVHYSTMPSHTMAFHKWLVESVLDRNLSDE